MREGRGGGKKLPTICRLLTRLRGSRIYLGPRSSGNIRRVYVSFVSLMRLSRARVNDSRVPFKRDYINLIAVRKLPWARNEDASARRDVVAQRRPRWRLLWEEFGNRRIMLIPESPEIMIARNEIFLIGDYIFSLAHTRV